MAFLSRLIRRPAPGPAPGPAPWEGAFDPAATADDVLACFRLLLGRLPNREEWSGHSSRAGEPLPGVVDSYLGSLEFARRGLAAAGTAPETVEGPGFRLHADAAAVVRLGAPGPDPEVDAFLRRVLRPGMCVVDVGAGLGWHAMLAATLVGAGGRIVAWEPAGPRARMLEASRRANGFEAVTVVQAAAGARAGLAALGGTGQGIVAPVPGDVPAVLAADTVPCLTLDAVLPPGRRFDLVRLGVADGAVLDGAAALLERDRPAILGRFGPGEGAGPAWLRRPGYALHSVGADGDPGPAMDEAAVAGAFRASGGAPVVLAALARA